MFNDNPSLEEPSPPRGERLPDPYTGPWPEEEGEPYPLQYWGPRRFLAVNVERTDTETDQDEFIIQTEHHGRVCVLENVVSRKGADDLEGECLQFVFKQVDPPGTIIGKEIVPELRWLRGFRPGAVHPEQTQLSDFYDADGAAVSEWQPARV